MNIKHYFKHDPYLYYVRWSFLDCFNKPCVSFIDVICERTEKNLIKAYNDTYDADCEDLEEVDYYSEKDTRDGVLDERPETFADLCELLFCDLLETQDVYAADEIDAESFHEDFESLKAELKRNCQYKWQEAMVDEVVDLNSKNPNIENYLEPFKKFNK